MSRSFKTLPVNLGLLCALVALPLGGAGCTGSDPYPIDSSEFPTITDSRSPMVLPSDVDPSEVSRQLNNLLAKDRPSPEEVNELTRVADEVLMSAAQRLGTTPEEFERLTPKEIAELVRQANEQTNNAVKVNLAELEKMTPKQRALIAQSANAVIAGALTLMTEQAQSALGTRASVVRIGVNELGGFAGSAAYLWVYLLELAGYTTVVEVASGAVLAEQLNAGQLDITFEAVPEFLEPGTAKLGVWSEGRLNVQGRTNLAEDLPEVAQGLSRFALDKDQMRSLAAVVKTRGVADPATQKAAVQLWLVDHPELLARLTGN